MWRLTVLTEWIVADDGAYTVAIADSVTSWQDITMQPDENILPAPNAVVVEVIVTDQQLNGIVDDNILTQEEI